MKNFLEYKSFVRTVFAAKKKKNDDEMNDFSFFVFRFSIDF